MAEGLKWQYTTNLWSTIFENPLLYANFTALYFIEPTLLKFNIAEIRNFTLFCRKIEKRILIYSAGTAKLMHMMPNHICWPIIDCSCTLPELHAFKVLFYAESVGLVTSGHVITMAVTPFHPELPKIPCYSKLHGSVFYGTGVTTDWSFTLRE